MFGYNKWEVFAFYETPNNESTNTIYYNTNHLSDASSAEIQSWINYQINRSEVKLGVSVSPNDVLMTIYTCATIYDSNPKGQGRLYFFLKAVG